MTFVTVSKKFKKEYLRLPTSIRDKVFERLDLFKKDKHDPTLNMHKLKGTLKNSFSINITGDLRIVFNYISHDTVELQRIGTHSQLYK